MSIQFKNVRFQWWKILRHNPTLSDFNKVLAFHITAEYSNSETNACWPSNDRLADDLGKDRRTIQRSLKCLEEKGFFDIICYHGRKRTNTILITEHSLSLALELKINNEKKRSEETKKGDTNDTLIEEQELEKVTNLSSKGDNFDQKTCQESHPNLTKQLKSWNLSQAHAQQNHSSGDDFDCLESYSLKSMPSIPVKIDSGQGKAWADFFQSNGIQIPPVKTNYNGQECWYLPSRWPQNMPPTYVEILRKQSNQVTERRIEEPVASIENANNSKAYVSADEIFNEFFRL